jgi:hypothetical protein
LREFQKLCSAIWNKKNDLVGILSSTTPRHGKGFGTYVS